MSKHAYTVRITREGKWWMIEVPELDILTQARRLAETEDMARSAIALTRDVPPGSFDLRCEITAVEHAGVSKLVDQLSADRADLARAEARYRARQREAANTLARNGITVRDIGYVLGVSHQRAQQLLDGQPKAMARAVTPNASAARTTPARSRAAGTSRKQATPRRAH